jgi:hypothetical protein
VTRSSWLAVVAFSIAACTEGQESDADQTSDGGTPSDARVFEDAATERDAQIDASSFGDAEVFEDATARDADSSDADPTDAEPTDASEPPDAEPPRDADVFEDANLPDAAPIDATPIDAMIADAQPRDAANADAEPRDANNPDASSPDASSPMDASVPDPAMSFFTTSTGNAPNGGNYGGISGADNLCQTLATAAGAGARAWRAYLSVSDYFAPFTFAHAKDRIGTGPWFNYYGQMIAADVAALHANGLDANLNFTELGLAVPAGDHDVMTGSNSAGEYSGGDTCINWTDNTTAGQGFVGHADWNLPTTIGNPSWNASHRALDCTQATLASTAGSGRIYCFAIN